jgi:hypothetical protein
MDYSVIFNDPVTLCVEDRHPATLHSDSGVCDVSLGYWRGMLTRLTARCCMLSEPRPPGVREKYIEGK